MTVASAWYTVLCFFMDRLYSCSEFSVIMLYPNPVFLFSSLDPSVYTSIFCSFHDVSSVMFDLSFMIMLKFLLMLFFGLILSNSFCQMIIFISFFIIHCLSFLHLFCNYLLCLVLCLFHSGLGL